MAEHIGDVNKKRTLVLFLLTRAWDHFREYGYSGRRETIVGHRSTQVQTEIVFKIAFLVKSAG